MRSAGDPSAGGVAVLGDDRLVKGTSLRLSGGGWTDVKERPLPDRGEAIILPARVR
jgi:hypothetical protein